MQPCVLPALTLDKSNETNATAIQHWTRQFHVTDLSWHCCVVGTWSFQASVNSLGFGAFAGKTASDKVTG